MFFTFGFSKRGGFGTPAVITFTAVLCYVQYCSFVFGTLVEACRLARLQRGRKLTREIVWF